MTLMTESRLCRTQPSLVVPLLKTHQPSLDCPPSSCRYFSYVKPDKRDEYDNPT